VDSIAAIKETKDMPETDGVGREEDETETEDGYYEDELEAITEDDNDDVDGKMEGKDLTTAERSEGKRVRFNLSATTIHEVTPYAEIYGVHPRTFVFDAESRKIPAARGGFCSAPSVEEEPAGLFSDASESSTEEDGGWESWLLEQDPENGVGHGEPANSTTAEPEITEQTSRLFSRGICVPDLDEETGWESWLDSVLGSTDDDLFYDPMP